jgi:hypothetical protein
MEPKYLLIILLGIIILMLLKSNFTNIESIGKTFYPTKVSEKIYSGHIPGSYLGLSDAEKKLLFHKFINNGDELI